MHTDLERQMAKAMGRWIACEFPERPVDLHLWADANCRSCLLALGAGVRSGQGELILSVVNPTNPDDFARLADVYESLRHQHDLPALAGPERQDAEQVHRE